MAERMHRGNSRRSPRTPSPEPGEPPMETSPVRGTGLQRSNAVRRIGTAMVQRRRDALSNERSTSPSPSSSYQNLRRPFSFERLGASMMETIPDPGPSSPQQLKALHKSMEREAVQRFLVEYNSDSEVDIDSETDIIVESEDTDTNGNISDGSSDTDRSEAMTQFAEKVHISRPGPARSYTQYNKAGRTATQRGARVHAASVAAAAAASNAPQGGGGQDEDEKEKPLICRKPRFPID